MAGLGKLQKLPDSQAPALARVQRTCATTRPTSAVRDTRCLGCYHCSQEAMSLAEHTCILRVCGLGLGLQSPGPGASVASSGALRPGQLQSLSPTVGRVLASVRRTLPGSQQHRPRVYKHDTETPALTRTRTKQQQEKLKQAVSRPFYCE